MTRLTLTLAAWMSFVPLASASRTLRPESSAFTNEVLRHLAPRLATRVPAQAAVQEARPEYSVTERTEILLDGKPCKYADVPAQASIVRMEVGGDKKTVLKIHFQNRK